jgi:hypothetical protein
MSTISHDDGLHQQYGKMEYKFARSTAEAFGSYERTVYIPDERNIVTKVISRVGPDNILIGVSVLMAIYLTVMKLFY